MKETETQAVKIARMEERMKTVEERLQTFRGEVLSRFDSLAALVQTDGAIYATKAELQKLEKLATRTRWIDGVIVSGVTAVVTFLIIYFLQTVKG